MQSLLFPQHLYIVNGIFMAAGKLLSTIQEAMNEILPGG
jgi:hypothetical protein